MNHTEYESMSQFIGKAEELRLAKINRQDEFRKESILEQIPLSSLMIISELKRLSDTLTTIEQHLDCIARNKK